MKAVARHERRIGRKAQVQKRRGIVGSDVSPQVVVEKRGARTDNPTQRLR